MQPLKFAVATAGFQQPLRTALKSAASTHAAGIVFDARYELTPQELSESGRRQLLHFLQELGLTTAAVHFPLRRPLHDLPELDRRLAAIKDTMAFTFQMKARVLTVRIGPFPEPADSPEARRMTQILEELAAHGNHVGVQLAVIPTQQSAEQLLASLQGIETGFVGVDFDPTAFLSAGEDPAQALRTLHDRLLHFEVRDAFRQQAGQIREVPVGRGEVEWIEVIPSLLETEYTGWLTASRTDGPDRVGDCARAIEYLQQIGWGG
ncbi:MAG: sugar phosphate isomerase/epimerase [Planctomycetales bacterium]